MRIVPLIASATETVHALGLGEFQVGRSHECDFPPQVASLPVCTRPRIDIEGSSRDIDDRVRATIAQAESVYEVLRPQLDALRPTHIFTQTQCRVCAVSLDDVERAMSAEFTSQPAVVALEPNTLSDVFRDIQRIADACDAGESGRVLTAALRAQLDSLRGTGRGSRIALLEWIEPPMYAAHWMPEIVEILGAQIVTLEDDPDAIVAAPCGWGVEKAREEMQWLTLRPGWSNLRCVKERRVYIADGNRFFNRPGPRVVESGRILAEILGGGAPADRTEWDRFA